MRLFVVLFVLLLAAARADAADPLRDGARASPEICAREPLDTGRVHGLLRGATAECITDDKPGYCVDRSSPFFVVVTDINTERKPHNMLLVPRARITGIEAPVLIQRPPPDYLYLALGVRRAVAAKVGRGLQERDVGVAINSAWTRSQCQLHVHVDCVRPDVRAAVDGLRPGAAGAILPGIAGIRAWFVPHERVPETNFFALASRVKPPRSSTADQGIALVEARDGGVAMLLGNVAQRTGDAEDLLDHSCKIAG